ncbi:uncharacterized protein LOC126810756 isoform X1 [Patella vulgata]|uniref:uncharacterized protein LOC126810756 isoform X1 n=1 Tax=Patella vulgata TaxID=6465 RepID=UPI002180705C|nr:uncharacterized protein LOC126810756 isoform X1 [Patella vulgata]
MDDLDYIKNIHPHYEYDTWDRHNSIAISATKGLRNAPGENNCFVNSAVQVFWHLDVFRRSYRRLNGHNCMGNSCIFCALKIIFTQFQYSDKSSLHPDALRKALAETFANQQRFQLGHMDDAAECFENILRRIHFHIAGSCEEDTCNAPHCLPHQKFAMQVVDQVVCSCGASSNPLKFHEMVHYISSSALVSQARSMQETGDILHPDRFGILLRNASTLGDIRDCPGNCGKKVPLKRTLLNCPDVVSIGLVWECDHPTAEMTTEVARNIGTTILLQDVFHTVMQDVKVLPKLHLVGVVCYYGKHYSTFLFNSKQQVWIYFDDATVREIGPRWENVVEKCAKGRYQPLLLLYANPNAVPVPIDTAMKKKVMAPGFTGVPLVDDSDSGHDRTQESIKSMNSSTPRRSRTPNPDGNNMRPDTDRRSRTPGPEYRPDPNNVPKRTDSDHRRQPSFLIAMSGKSDRPNRVPLRPGGSSTYAEKDNIPDYGYNPHPNNRQQYNAYGREDVDDYTLSTRDQYRRPSLNSMSPQNTQHISRSTAESQRKEPFKKGNTKVRADVIRYVPGDYNGGHPGYNGQVPRHMEPTSLPPGDGPPPYQSRALSVPPNLDDSISVHSDIVNPNQHRVVKPSTGNHNYENINTSTHTPVEVGIATLPRKKKQQSPSEPNTMTRQSSMGNLSSQGSHPRQSSRDLVDGPSAAKVEPKPVRKTVAQVKRASDKKKPPPPKRSNSLPRNTEPHPEDFVDDKIVYIDRKMVANILDQQRHSTPHSNGSVNGTDDTLMSKLLNSKGLSVEIPYDNVSLGSHKDSGYGSSDRNSSSSTGSVTMDPYNQFFLTRGMIVPTPTPAPNNYSQETSGYNKGEVTLVNGMPKSNSTNSMKQDLTSQFENLKLNRNGEVPPPVPVKNYNVEVECPQPIPAGNGLDKDGMKNEQFKTLLGFADDLMDQCMLAETNKDYPSAVHYCDTAIGYLKSAINLKNITHQMVVFAQNRHSSCLMKSRSLKVRLSSRSDSKLSPVNDLRGSTDNRSSINSTDSDLSRASQERTRRTNGSSERLDNLDKPGLPVSHMNSLHDRQSSNQSLHNTQNMGPDHSRLPDNSRSLCRTLSDHSKNASNHSYSDSNSSVRTCVPSGHVSQSSRDSTLSNNSDMYGSLPRRTARGPPPKEEVYQSYLNKQKSLHQGVEHARSSSGSSTTNSIDGSIHSDNSGSDPQLRSHLRSQPRMSKSDIRQMLQKNIAQRQAHGSTNSRNTQQGQTVNRIQQNESPVPQTMVKSADAAYRQPNTRQPEVGSYQRSVPNTACRTSGPLSSTGVPTTNGGNKPRVIKPCIKQKPIMVASQFSKSSNCLNVYGGKALERCTSQPDCQKLVDSPFFNNPDSLSNTMSLKPDKGLRASSASQPDLRNLTDERFNSNIVPHDNLDSSGEDAEAMRLNVRALASRFETSKSPTNQVVIVPKDIEKPTVGHRVRSKSESSSVKKPKSVLTKTKNKSSRPRKSVTFSENLALVAGETGGYQSSSEINSSRFMDDPAYYSDDEDRRPRSHFNNDEDIDSNNSDESPPIGTGAGFCELCQKQGIEIDENYCSKCRFYMHRFMPSS